MKSLFIFLLVFGLSIPAFAVSPPASSEKETPKVEKAKEEKGKIEKAGDEKGGTGVEFAKVNSKVSEALCQKMQQCAAQKMPPSQCLSEVKGTFQQSYDSLPKEKRFGVAAPDLDLCVKSIKARAATR